MEISINKNRGWRGLAEVKVMFKEECASRSVFSFSQAMWYDMLLGYIVVFKDNKYNVIHFDNSKPGLPSPTQQRSVLIKNYTTEILEIKSYDVNNFRSTASSAHILLIEHFLKNNNNHTKSDWNNVGIRVLPII